MKLNALASRMNNRLKSPFQVFIYAIGTLFLTLGDTATAKERKIYTEMPKLVEQALVRELGAKPKITGIRGQMTSKYSYEEGSIGTRLYADQWRESQAWQSLAGYNTAKQARHHDVDSIVWCTLRGGGNSGTYMKPLIDFNDHIKLAFYTYKSTLQKYYAASKGVDVAYGPADKITPVLIGLGEERVLNLTIRCINKAGKVASVKKFTDIKLPSGRPILELAAYRPDIKTEGFYAVTYVVDDKGSVLGRTFELKYFSNDKKADGSTDFHGGTGIFSKDQRVAFLGEYAKQACRFFGDPMLDKKVITDAEVDAALKAIKAQPLPEVRKRLVLNSGWKHLAYRHGETSADKKRLESWSTSGAKIKDGQLVLTRDDARVVRTFDSQDWRFFLQWRVVPVEGKRAEFTLGDGKRSIITIGIDDDGKVTAGNKRAGSLPPGSAAELKLEIDLQYKQFSLYVDGKRMIYAGDITELNEVNTLTISGGRGVAVDDIWGTGYDPAEDIRNGIFEIRTFIDEDFAVSPLVDSWQSSSYDDGEWAGDGELPIIVGSERNKGRDIYIRKTVEISAFQQAFLNVDALDPSGEVFINGKSVAKLNRRPVRLDVTRFLKPGSNLIAVKVDHVVDGFYLADGHTSKDLYYGWFAARMSLDLTSPVHVDDVFVYTEKLGDPATVKVTVELSNDGTKAFDGEAVIRFFPWYPTESANASVEEHVAIKLAASKSLTISRSISLPNPLLWDYKHPNLYRVTVTLLDGTGKSQDDYVVTTGIRTISEEGGIFRINGREEVLNGATWMQFLAPFTESTTWHRCCPKEWIVKGILMTRAMAGNTIRKHEASSAYSDPRFAEIGDQLGIMYMWVSTGWARKEWTKTNKNPDGSAMSLDKSVEEFTLDMRQVRNSPSIVMWEIFNEGVSKGNKDKVFKAFYPAMFKTDSSRFIMPLKGNYHNDPMVAKGGQIDTLGYAKKWKALRDRPMDELGQYAKDKNYGMYAVEFAEVTGMDNWNLAKVKPWYKVYSYEWGPVLYQIKCVVDGKDVELLISEEGRIISKK